MITVKAVYKRPLSGDIQNDTFRTNAPKSELEELQVALKKDASCSCERVKILKTLIMLKGYDIEPAKEDLCLEMF